jgi:hypothetical protein
VGRPEVLFQSGFQPSGARSSQLRRVSRRDGAPHDRHRRRSTRVLVGDSCRAQLVRGPENSACRRRDRNGTTETGPAPFDIWRQTVSGDHMMPGVVTMGPGPEWRNRAGPDRSHQRARIASAAGCDGHVRDGEIARLVERHRAHDPVREAVTGALGRERLDCPAQMPRAGPQLRGGLLPRDGRRRPEASSPSRPVPPAGWRSVEGGRGRRG